MASVSVLVPNPATEFYVVVTDEITELSRVPCVGEHISLGDLNYEVVIVRHLVDKAHARDADIYVHPIDIVEMQRRTRKSVVTPGADSHTEV